MSAAATPPVGHPSSPKEGNLVTVDVPSKFQFRVNSYLTQAFYTFLPDL